jgi:hypothetical protein
VPLQRGNEARRLKVEAPWCAEAGRRQREIGHKDQRDGQDHGLVKLGPGHRPDDAVDGEAVRLLELAHARIGLGAEDAVDRQRRAAADVKIEHILQCPDVLSGRPLR